MRKVAVIPLLTDAETKAQKGGVISLNPQQSQDLVTINNAFFSPHYAKMIDFKVYNSGLR